MYTDLEELELIFSPLNIEVVPTLNGWFEVFHPGQHLFLKRGGFYWTVMANPGLPKEAAVDLCATWGDTVRALGFGRRGLTPQELREILSSEYHEYDGGYCRSWDCDSLPGLRVLVEKLIGVS